ncbi:MAG: hypothetical protein IJ298_04205 [Ruminococcus sp.]|nr:hypothetical protein [Ruminococcus sp.]
MKRAYVEPVMELFMFSTSDTVVASAVTTQPTTTVAEYNVGEDVIPDASASGENASW